MTEEQSAAYINSRAACVIARALGMMSENLQRLHRDEAMAYSAQHFDALIDEYGISYNAVHSVIRGCR